VLTDIDPKAMEQLAFLTPSHEQVSPHALKMFWLVRGFVTLDWVMRHPNDMSQEMKEAKFAGLVEKSTEIVTQIQREVEANGHKKKTP